MRICSVTILYHPENTFFSYISSYIDKVQKAFIIDNSEVRNCQVIEELTKRFGTDKIHYIQNKSNQGVAASLNKAFIIAHEDGFDWILTMDQDSYFEGHHFFDISVPLMQQSNVAIIAASYYNKMPFKKNYSALFYQLLFVVTSGNLVSIESWKQAGGFEEKLFIDEVDNDFCLRLNKRHCLVLSSKEILLKHTTGVSFFIRPPFFKKPLPIGIHSPQRMYFIIRNGLYVMKRHAMSYPAFFLNRLRHLSIKLFLVFFFYPNKRKYLWFFYKGVKDFFLSRFSNNF